MIGRGDLATIISYFLPLVDWYCLRPFNNREIEDWRPSVLGYCLLQDISPNMCAYTLSIDAYIRWHSATLGIWISEARSLRWMSRICSIVATPIYFLRTKAKLERSDSKFAALSFPGCKLFSVLVRMKRLDLLILNFMSCHLLESFHLFFPSFPNGSGNRATQVSHVDSFIRWFARQGRRLLLGGRRHFTDPWCFQKIKRDEMGRK